MPGQGLDQFVHNNLVGDVARFDRDIRERIDRVAFVDQPEEALFGPFRRFVRAQVIEHEHGQAGPWFYFVMEYVDGTSLRQMIRAKSVAPREALSIVMQTCDALQFAHDHGVVHRDVKPGNVLLSEEGEVKLTDFGIALIDHPDATVDDRLLGTLSYMSPEQAVNAELDGGTDVWAASLMAYEALTGDNPYRARTPQGLQQLHDRPRLLLSDFIRHELGLTGTHVGCEHGVCGACTILVDDEPARSCLMLAVQASGSSLTTVEGLAPSDDTLSPLQQAFWEAHGLQCGFCTPGILISVQALLRENPRPTDEEIRAGLSGNLCRCTGYQNIVKAVRIAAERLTSTSTSTDTSDGNRAVEGRPL